MDGVLLTVADPDMILGIYAQRVGNQKFARRVNVIKKVVVPIAAPGLDKVTVFIKLMDCAVAVTVGDIHVAQAVVVDVGRIVERLAAGHGGALLIPLKRAAAAFLVQRLGSNDALVHAPIGQCVLVDMVSGTLMEGCKRGLGPAGLQIQAHKAVAAHISEQQLFAVRGDLTKVHTGNVAGTNRADKIAFLIQLQVAAQRIRAHKAAAAQAAIDVTIFIRAATGDVAAEGYILILFGHILHKIQDDPELKPAVGGFDGLFHNFSAIGVAVLDIHYQVPPCIGQF